MDGTDGAAEPPRPARFFARVSAFCLDVVTLVLADIAVLVLASEAIDAAQALRGGAFSGAAEVIAGCAVAGIVALSVSYFVALHASGGQTLGKALCGIAVRSTSGGPIGLPQSLLRWFGYFTSALPLGLGFFVAALPPGRALHDRLAGTVVVKIPRSEP